MAVAVGTGVPYILQVIDEERDYTTPANTPITTVNTPVKLANTPTTTVNTLVKPANTPTTPVTLLIHLQFYNCTHTFTTKQHSHILYTSNAITVTSSSTNIYTLPIQQ